MKVTVRWTEEVEYTSVIDVDEAEYREWIEGAEPTDDNLLAFLREDSRDDDDHYIEALTVQKVHGLTNWCDYDLWEATPHRPGAES